MIRSWLSNDVFDRTLKTSTGTSPKSSSSPNESKKLSIILLNVLKSKWLFESFWNSKLFAQFYWDNFLRPSVQEHTSKFTFYETKSWSLNQSDEISRSPICFPKMLRWTTKSNALMCFWKCFIQMKVTVASWY